MNKNINTLNILSLIFLVMAVGCGKAPLSFYKAPAIVNSPHFLPYADKNCQISSDNGAISIDSVGQQLVWRSTPQTPTATNSKSYNITASPIVREVLSPYSNTYIRINELEKITDMPTLKFCPHSPNFGHYPKDSIEGMALSTYATIGEAYAFYKTLVSQDKLIRTPLSLIISPYIEIEVDRNVDYMTDNAFYDGKVNKYQVIAVVPHSDEMLADKPNLRNAAFWRHSFVVAHEFGHFVLEQYTHLSGNNGEDINMRGMHEAFGDLFAHLANQEYNFQDKLSGNRRDITDENFTTRNGITYKKRLSHSVLSNPDFKECHDLGAVLAYTLYQTMKELYPHASTQELGKMTMEWVISLGSHTTNLKEMLTKFKDVLTQHKANSAKKSVAFDAVFGKYFPAYF